MVGEGERDEQGDDDAAARDRPRIDQSDSRLFATQARADQYSAWAERLREKRTRNQERIRGAQSDVPDERATYWTTEALFDESQRVEQEELESGDFVRHTRQLLAMFNLNEGASMKQITDAYRGLAKLHHPDRYVAADADTQHKHADQMQRLNAAYRALRKQHQT